MERRTTKATHKTPLNMKTVQIQFEIIRTERDIIEIGDGTMSLGELLDHHIKCAREQGDRLGKFTFDLSELFNDE